MFALVKFGFTPSSFGKIWAAFYWNMGKAWMLLLCQKMAKSVCPPSTSNPTLPVMTPEQSQICAWWGLAKSGNPINGKIGVLLKSSTPSDEFWKDPHKCLRRRIFSSALSYMIHGFWPFITISAPSWWNLISSCASHTKKCLKERPWCLKTWHIFSSQPP